MQSELVALDGVKFLSLARPRLDLVDDVIREIVVGKLILSTESEAPPAASAPPPPVATAAANAGTAAHQDTGCKSSSVPLIPYIASVQYSVLEDEADMIYGLIRSVTRRMGLAVDENVQNDPLPGYISSWKNETVQADKLLEFSQFRKEIMARLPTIPKEIEDDDDSLLENWDTITSLRKSSDKIPKRRATKRMKNQ